MPSVPWQNWSATYAANLARRRCAHFRQRQQCTNFRSESHLRCGALVIIIYIFIVTCVQKLWLWPVLQDIRGLSGGTPQVGGFPRHHSPPENRNINIIFCMFSIKGPRDLLLKSAHRPRRELKWRVSLIFGGCLERWDVSVVSQSSSSSGGGFWHQQRLTATPTTASDTFPVSVRPSEDIILPDRTPFRAETFPNPNTPSGCLLVLLLLLPQNWCLFKFHPKMCAYGF